MVGSGEVASVDLHPVQEAGRCPSEEKIRSDNIRSDKASISAFHTKTRSAEILSRIILPFLFLSLGTLNFRMSSSSQEPEFHFQDPAVSEAEREKGLGKPLRQAFDGPSASGVSSDEVEQAGTKKIEAITSSWSKWGLIIAYIS